jgi:hypothetical protein
MSRELTKDEKRTLTRMANEPFFWLRKLVPEVKQWEDQFFDLLDHLKASWQEARGNRINLCFMLEWTQVGPEAALSHVRNVVQLQKKQNAANSTLVFSIDLSGNVIDEIDLATEIEPESVTALSKLRGSLVCWLGADFEIICKGVRWNPKNKGDVLKEIKSKKRDLLLTMDDYQLVLKTHYEQKLRGEASVDYWFPGKRNEILQPRPERIFQKSLWEFFRTEVDCVADREPMFKDYSRCDIRVFTNDYDIYFIEVKWIGHCAVKKRESPIVSAEHAEEADIRSAIAGALQTKLYIEKNNSIQYDNRIKLGIVLVYDAYPTPRIPIAYPEEIQAFPLVESVEFALVTTPPSVLAKEMARRPVKTPKTLKAAGRSRRSG